MNHPASEGQPNGSGLATAPVASSNCALSALPSDVHQYIHALEARIAHLESEQNRFMNALQFAGKMLFENPAMKMFASAFPKDVKAKLQEFFGNTVTGKN